MSVLATESRFREVSCQPPLYLVRRFSVDEYHRLVETGILNHHQGPSEIALVVDVADVMLAGRIPVRELLP